MSEITFQKTPEQIEHFKNNPIVMGAEEGLYFAWATDPAALAAVLPKGMEPVSPVVFGYFTHIGDPTFCVGYREVGIMTVVSYDGQLGVYPIAFLLDKGDTGTFMGRDVLSIPKKTADSITIERNGDAISCTVTRMGVDLLSINATIGEFNDPLCAKVFASRTPGEEVPGLNYFYKFDTDMTAEGAVDISNERLLCCPITMVYRSWENASIDVTLGASANDPWAALPVVKPLGGGWTAFDCAMKGVARTIPIEGDEAADAVAKNMAQRFDIACME